MSNNIIRINGGIDNAEAHLTSYGVAALVEGSRIRWGSRSLSVIVPDRQLAIEAIGEAVRSAVTPVTGWLAAGAEVSGGKFPSAVTSFASVSPFTPKQEPTGEKDEKGKVIKSAPNLDARFAARERVSRDATAVQSDVIAAMGMSAHWRDYNAAGASQLMAHVDNAGRDQIVTNILAPAGSVDLHTWDNDRIIEVLENGGGPMHDKSDWTGDPTSPLRTVLSVYGMWALPTVVRVSGPSFTAGFDRERRKKGGKASKETKDLNERVLDTLVLPIFGSPVSVAKLRAVVSHGNWTANTPRGRRWRSEQNVVASASFNFQRENSNNDNAPMSCHFERGEVA